MLILFDLESLKGLLLLSVDDEVVGTANRATEEQTWIHFVDFLDECEGTFTLSTQAQAIQCRYYFPYVNSGRCARVTGADRVPPLGFEKQPIVTFCDGKYATASTCSLELRLPTQ